MSRLNGDAELLLKARKCLIFPQNIEHISQIWRRIAPRERRARWLADGAKAHTSVFCKAFQKTFQRLSGGLILGALPYICALERGFELGQEVKRAVFAQGFGGFAL